MAQSSLMSALKHLTLGYSGPQAGPMDQFMNKTPPTTDSNRKAYPMNVGAAKGPAAMKSGNK